MKEKSSCLFIETDVINLKHIEVCLYFVCVFNDNSKYKYFIYSIRNLDAIHLAFHVLNTTNRYVILLHNFAT